jgi:uncharacterized membrane protein
MRYRRPRAVGVVAVMLAFLASAVAYPELPARMATHWGVSGEVNGTMSRLIGAFVLPALAAGVYAFMLISPRFDPRKQNIEAFRGLYEWFAAGMAWFLLYTHGLVLLWNLGVRPPIGAALAPGLAAVLYASGLLVERAEPNWIAGIRTPWTLNDSEVWEQTNRQAALALKLAGILALGGLVLPEFATAFILVPALLAAAYVTVYSFIAYRRQRTT